MEYAGQNLYLTTSFIQAIPQGHTLTIPDPDAPTGLYSLLPPWYRWDQKIHIQQRSATLEYVHQRAATISNVKQRAATSSNSQCTFRSSWRSYRTACQQKKWEISHTRGSTSSPQNRDQSPYPKLYVGGRILPGTIDPAGKVHGDVDVSH